MISTILACAADEFQKSRKIRYLKMRKQSTLIKISSVWCFLKSARLVYYNMHLNLIKNKLETIFLKKKIDFCILTKKKTVD